MTLRTLHVVSSLRLSAGGPTQSVTQLCEALNEMGAQAEIATVAGIAEDFPEVLHTPLHRFPLAMPRRFRRSPDLAAFLEREAGRFDLIHAHGLWEWPTFYARRAAERHGRPFVLSPRGMLEPWALQQNATIKRLALRFWERANLQHAALLHATSQAEAAQFAALALRPPVAVVPNGLKLPMPPEPLDRDGRRALFLSRLHPKKGLLPFLRAWAAAGAPSRGWSLDLAGPDEDNHRAALEAEALRLGIQDSVRFLGPVHGPAKWDLIRRAAFLLLPSHSENFGNVVVEALSQGVPVLATRGTPWESLEQEDCGWWVPLSEPDLVNALRSILALTPSELVGMGRKGLVWSHATFSASATASALLRHYAQLIPP